MRQFLTKTLLVLLMTLPAMAFAQVKGVVCDKNTGEPLVGVSVVVKGQSIGTMTDIDGNFNIKATAKDALVFTYVGYNKVEYDATPGKAMQIFMAENAIEMQEVVVVGVAMKKSDLTGAVQHVSAESLKNVPTADVNQALQGKVPGVYVKSSPRPGETASIKVRGNNSISYGTNPIYVVDGLVMDNGFDALNPNDIESIDVLKDASATAIYGARGANGVIVITTKKGKSKEGKITYNGWVGFQDFTKKMETINGIELFDLRAEAYTNQYRHDHPDKTEEQVQKYAERSFYTTSANRNLAFSAGELAAYEQFLAMYEADPNTPHDDLRYDWVDMVTQPGFQQNHSLDFSKATDNGGSIYVSLGYNKQKGQVIDTGYERFTGKVNVEQPIKSWLKVGTNNTFSYSEQQPSKADIFYSALNACLLLEPSEDYTYMPMGKIENQSTTNPLLTKYIERDLIQSRLLSSSYVNISPIKGLDIRSTFSLNYQNYEDYSYYGLKSANSINQGCDGQSVQKKGRNVEWAWDNSVAYNNTFNEVHRVSALFSMSYSRLAGNYNQINAQGYGSDLFGYKNMGGASDKEHVYYASDFWASTLASYMLRANYSFDSRYYITLTGRFDGSSKFGPNNKWGFFPSVAASWNIANEHFMDDVRDINNLRLRVGYGVAGNQNIDRYRYYTLFNPSVSLNSPILTNGGEFGNPNLRWEEQKQINVGLDFGAWNDRLNFSVDYFHIDNENLLMMRTMAASTGYLQRMDNVGCLTNQGVEFTINATPIETKDWNWTIGFNLALDKNEITSLYDDVDHIYNLGGYSGNEVQSTGNLFIGESINNYYLYEFDRIIQNNEEDLALAAKYSASTGRVIEAGDVLPKDQNKDGFIDDNDRIICGSSDPLFYGGLSTTLSWKGLSLDVFCNYSYGGKQISWLYEGLLNTAGMPVSTAHIDILDRWTPENPSNTIPRAAYIGGRYSRSETSLALQDASFFRLSNVTLSYTFPAKLTRKAYIENLRLYVTGNNLLTATKYKGYDPEMGDYYPATRMYVVGLNITF